MKPQESLGGKPGEVIFLVKRGVEINLTLHYDVPPPSPDEDFELDLGPTIVGPTQGKLPIVKFKPIPWSYDSRNP